MEHLVYGGTIHSFMLYAGVLEAGMEGAAAVGPGAAQTVTNGTKFGLK